MIPLFLGRPSNKSTTQPVVPGIPKASPHQIGLKMVGANGTPTIAILDDQSSQASSFEKAGILLFIFGYLSLRGSNLVLIFYTLSLLVL